MVGPSPVAICHNKSCTACGKYATSENPLSFINKNGQICHSIDRSIIRNLYFALKNDCLKGEEKTLVELDFIECVLRMRKDPCCPRHSDESTWYRQNNPDCKCMNIDVCCSCAQEHHQKMEDMAAIAAADFVEED